MLFTRDSHNARGVVEMGFLRRLVGAGGPQPSGGGGRRWLPPGPITTWPADSFGGTFDARLFEPADRATVEVSSHYQATLEQIAGGRTVDGPRNRDHQAMLIPEPSNPYDHHAVRVYLGPPWGKVAYLSREDASRYRPVIDRLASMGKLTACLASLKGGWDRGPGDRGLFWLTLLLDTPPNLMIELDKDYGPDPRWPSPQIEQPARAAPLSYDEAMRTPWETLPPCWRRRSNALPVVTLILLPLPTLLGLLAGSIAGGFLGFLATVILVLLPRLVRTFNLGQAFVAIVFPPWVFYKQGRQGESLANFSMCCTIILWPVAAIWALASLAPDARSRVLRRRSVPLVLDLEDPGDQSPLVVQTSSLRAPRAVREPPRPRSRSSLGPRPGRTRTNVPNSDHVGTLPPETD
jgi:hypothetical protein